MDDQGPATFEARLDEEFRGESPTGEPLVLRLIEVNRLGYVPGAPRAEPFALLFAGPALPSLGQGTHHLTHALLGDMDVFLVPVGRTPAGGLLYEAIFN